MRLNPIAKCATLMMLIALMLCPRIGQAQGKANNIYATLGPEAPAILRVLVGDSHMVALQPGDLSNALKTQLFTALVVSQDWAASDDLSAARRAGLQIVLVQRHNSVASMENNIRTLAALTGMQAAGDRWNATIDQGLAQVKASVQGMTHPRVLILTPEGYTEGQGAFITELIGIASGLNVAADAGIAEARQIEDRQIRDLTPDVVLLINWTTNEAAEFAHSPLYAGLPAFDHNRIYRIATPGRDPARLVEEIQTLADLLHLPIF